MGDVLSRRRFGGRRFVEETFCKETVCICVETISRVRCRVRRFRFKNFFASKRNEAKRDPFRMRFARSRGKKLFFFRFISLLFASNFSLPTKAK